jgi:hypothetical protein
MRPYLVQMPLLAALFLTTAVCVRAAEPEAPRPHFSRRFPWTRAYDALV